MYATTHRSSDFPFNLQSESNYRIAAVQSLELKAGQSYTFVIGTYKTIYSAKFGLLIQPTTLVGTLGTDMWLPPQPPPLNSTTDCYLAYGVKNRYVLPFTATSDIYLIDLPPQFFDAAAILYSNYNIGNPPMNCPSVNDTTQFIVTADVGDGEAIAVVLNKSSNYTLITTHYAPNTVLYKVVVFMYTGTRIEMKPQQWTWIYGSNTTNQIGYYQNPVMGSRSSPAYWTDSQNNVYVFGGYGYASDVNYAALSDVWKFDGNYWTFVTGSNTSYNWGNYGTKGVTSSSNLIPARRSHSFGTDSKGNLWVFGGSLTTFFNDLWKFDGKNWTWISGNNSYYNRGVGNYGTQGVSSSFNYPGGRWYSSLQIDSQDNIWMFGGSYDATQTYFFNDLWKFNGVNWTWISGSNSTNQSGIYGVIRVGSASNRIGARQPAITWIDTSNNLWVFGGYGYDSNGTVGYLNDLWKFDGSVWTWISGSNVAGSSGNYGTKGVASSVAVPPCRVRSSGFSNGNEFFLFGGDSANFAYNDIWKFDGSNWTWIAGHNKSNQVGVYSANGYPGARSGSAFVKDSNNNFYVFGGFGAPATTQWGFLNDVWKFNGSQWTWLSGADTTNTIGFYEKIAGPIGPGAREEQTCAMDSLDNLWMFGGFIYNGGYYSHLNDLWKYNGTKWIWVSGSKTVDSQGSYGIKGVSSASNAPSARYSHAMAIRNDTIWMYGGINQYGVHNDLWRYDRGNWTWMYGSNLGGLGVVYGTKGVPSSNNTPGGRYSCAMEIDSQNRIWLFGGDAGGYRNDLWKFDGQWTWIGGPNSTNAAGVYGTMGVAVSTNIPGARKSHDSWIDSNNVLWIFGGQGYDSSGTVGQLNDLWSYNGVNWTWVSGFIYSNSYANYGVKGVASSSNVPGGRSSHNMWGDRFNQIWIFGGYGYGSSGAGTLNDLWKFDGFTWTWVSGSKSLNVYGNYTIGGNPGSRSGACGDINSSNFIWLFGGNGLSATASGGQLNDLWNYGAA